MISQYPAGIARAWVKGDVSGGNLSADGDLLKHPEDKPAIGLLLCRSKNRIVVEHARASYSQPLGARVRRASPNRCFLNSGRRFPAACGGELPYALRDLKKPVGVAQWETKIVTSLPRELKGSLPSIEALERELGYKG